ncbi:VOC family protein [Microcoleus sp. OTE_8_concoct_300]|uniref:VOC family protein n=1 Tax=Microcoleus sp. OTE_8_concoct_300 TaxID=2964710 RepID=UPI00403FA19A
MSDIGLTHIALPVSDVDRTIEFYSKYAGMQVVHRRIDAKAGVAVVWLSDRTRPFVIVLIQTESVHPVLSPFAHLGVGCKSREYMDSLCDKARQEGVLLEEPKDAGYPATGLFCETRTVTRSNYPTGKKSDLQWIKHKIKPANRIRGYKNKVRLCGLKYFLEDKRNGIKTIW